MKSEKQEIILCSAKECTGCFSCEGTCPVHAISHTTDNEGFFYPTIDLNNCIGCHSCENHCPVLNPVEKYPLGKVYAGWSLSDDIRQKSSSGGIFTELASHFLSEGGVVVGAELDENGMVSHRAIYDKKELSRLRGSKYVQSDIRNELYQEIKEAIKANKKVLFTGTPCQVSAVKILFKDTALLYTVDIICHGVPSPALFKQFFIAVNEKYNGIERLNFRLLEKWGEGINIDKRKGRCIENIVLSGDDTYYLEAFNKGLLNRACCYSCRYASTERVGDITLGDFWGIGSLKDFVYDTQKGCSIIIVNSDKGGQIIKDVKHNLYLEEREIEETIIGGNEQLQHPLVRPKGRETIYSDMKTKDMKFVISNYGLRPKKKFIVYRIFLRILRIIKS